MAVPDVDLQRSTSTPPPPGPELLPGLDRWTPFEQGEVPEHLDQPSVALPHLEADPDAALVTIPGAGRYLARVGRAVLVEPWPSATHDDVTSHLSGPVRAAQEALNGRTPLHAAAISVAGRAVLVCGGPGTGKSAVAAALACRGHRLLADAIGLVDLPAGIDDDASDESDRAAPIAVPTSDEVVIGPAVLRDLCLPPSAGRGTRPGLLERTVTLGRPGRPAPLAHVVVLHTTDEALSGRRTVRTPIDADDVPEALEPVRWHPDLTDALRGVDAFPSWATELAAAVPFSELRWSAGAALAETADAVEELAT